MKSIAITLLVLVLPFIGTSQKIKKTFISFHCEYYPELPFKDDIKSFQVKVVSNIKNSTLNDQLINNNYLKKIKIGSLERKTSDADITLIFEINDPAFQEKKVDENGRTLNVYLNKIRVSIIDNNNNYYLNGYANQLSTVNQYFYMEDNSSNKINYDSYIKNTVDQVNLALNSIFNYNYEKINMPLFYLKGNNTLENLAERVKNNMKKDTLFVKHSSLKDSLSKIVKNYNQLLKKIENTPENTILKETILYNISVLNLLNENYSPFEANVSSLMESEEKDFSWIKSEFMVKLYNNKTRFHKFEAQKQNGTYDPYFYPIYDNPYHCVYLKKLTQTGYIITKKDTIKCELYTKPAELDNGKIEYTIDRGKNKVLFNNYSLIAIIYSDGVYMSKGQAGKATVKINPDLKINRLYYLYELIYKSPNIELYKIENSNEILIINNLAEEHHTASFPKGGKMDSKKLFIENIKRVFPNSDSVHKLLENDYEPMNNLETYLEIIQLAENFNSKEKMEPYLSKAYLSRFSFN